MKLRSCKKLLVSRSFNPRLGKAEMTNSLAQKCRLACLHLDHREADLRSERERQGKSRRPATGTNVHEVDHRRGKMPRCDHRLEKKAVDGFVGILE